MAKHDDMEAKIERLENKEEKAKLREAHFANTFVRKGTNTVASGVYGALDLYGVPKTIKGVPWKLGVWLLTTATEAFAEGLMQSAASGISDSTMTLYIHDSIKNKTIIAGNGDAKSGGEV